MASVSNVSGDGSFTVSGTANVTAASGKTITVNNTAYSATGSVTLNVASGSVSSISGASSTVTVTIGGTNYTLQSGQTLTYTNGTWTGGVEYTSYVYDNGTMYGVYADGSDTLTYYADVFYGNEVKTTKQLTYKGSGTVIANGTTYTVNNGTATFTSSGIGSVASGSVTYTKSDSTFTADDGKEYTTTGNVTYKTTDGSTWDVETAQGTRAFGTNDTDTKNDGTYTYNVTAGTYSITISNGSGTAVLDSGTATKIFSANDTFSYTPNGGQSHSYTAESGGVTYNISFDGNNITEGTKSGSGTRNDGTGTYEHTGDNAGTYTLSNGAIMKLTFGANPEEEFYSGSATSGSLTSFKIGTNTYTGNATLTLTRSGGNSDTYSLASGSGTRSASVTTFTYPPGNGGKSYSGDVTYTLAANAANESLLAGTGTRTDISGDTYTVGNNTYNLTEGTYSLTFSGADYNVEPTLTSATGTTTVNQAFTISGDSKEYTPLNSPLTLTLNYDGTNATESFTGNVSYVDSTANQTFTGKDDKTYTTNSITYKKSGSNGDATVYNATGTRAYESSDDVTFDYQGNNYKVTAGTYTDTVSSGTKATPTLTTTTAVFTANTGSTFRVNDSTTYTATAATTFTLNSGNATPTMSGEGTRTAAGTEKYTSNDANNGGAYTLSSGAIMKLTLPAGTEDFYNGSATRTTDSYNDGTHTYTTTGNNLELTWSKSDGTDNGVTFTSGTGTRTDTADFTYANTGKTYKPVGNATYTLTAGQSEKLYNATGTRTDVINEDYSYNDHNYKLTDGTYQIDVTGGATNASETFINGSGSGTVTAGTFTYGGNTCTPLENVVFNLSVSNNGAAKTETFKSGSVTYEKDDNTFTAKNDKTYTSTDSNVTYKLVRANDADTTTVYSATGTRAFGSAAGDSATDTYNGDTYKVTAGTYSYSISDGQNETETLKNSTATYSVSNGGTFHFGSRSGRNTFVATAPTTLTISYDANGNKSLTAANGEGTRTATAEDSGITFTYDSDTYNTNVDATIKAVINGTGDPTESFLYGTATHTGDFHYGDKAYTAEAGAEITYNKTSGGAITKTFAAGSAGTRTDSASTFTYNGDGKTYNSTSTDITYRASTSSASTSLTEITYAAEGTRKSDGNDTFTGDWGNVYKIPNGTGTVHIKVVNGTATVDNAPTVTDGNATNTYTAGSSFTYSDNQTYTANHEVKLSLSAISGNGTETFESGSAQNGDSYIVKTGSQVDIGEGANKITYTATGSDIVTVTAPSTGITALSDDSTITGAFTSGQSATIGGITYKSTGTTSLAITGTRVDEVTANGTFEATGDFSTARTLNSQTLNVTGDTDVKATFSTSGVTKIENLGGTATIVNAGGATTVITNETGTFTIGGTAYAINQGTATFTLNSSGKVTKIEATQSNGSFQFGANQTFTIADDATEGVTFTIDPTSGTANKIEGLQRTDATYAHVTVTDDGETTNLYVRRNGDNPVKTNGKWVDKDIINFYVVTYDGTNGTNGFTVQAVDKDNNSTLVNITSDDYTSTTGTPPTLTFSDTTKQIVVKNSTSNAIKVGALDGEINNTGGKAIRIDANGDFKIGTFEGITFTESLDGNFDVSEKAEFTVDNTGQINVSVKDGQSGMVEVEAPKNADLHITTEGTFKINGGSIIKIDNNTAQDVKINFNNNGSVAGIKANGKCKVTVMPNSSSSYDLAESADITYNRSTFHIEDKNGKIVYVIVSNDANDTIGYETDSDGKLIALHDVSTDASVLLTGDIEAVVTEGFKINSTDVSGDIELDTAIRLNSTTGNWTCGDTEDPLDTSSNKYKVEIGNDNKILLYVNGAQTKNVADYKAVFGENGPQPTKDDGVLPTYPAAGITFDSTNISNIDSLKITPPTSASSYKIQDYDFTISGETTFTPTDDTTLEVGLKVGATVVYDGATYTSNAGTSKLTVSDAGITLDANAKVTNVSGKTYTVGTDGTLTFDGVTINNLDGGTAITGVTTNTNSTTMTIDTTAIAVNGDKTYTIDANADKITGISNGAQVTANGFEIETDSAGTFKVGSQDFVVAGDDKVTFTTNASSVVEKIADLSAAGSITGDFRTAINVNADGNIVQVTSDTNIGVVGGSGTVSKLYNISNNAVVASAGGAATISTDGAGGTFTFGDTPQKYQISAGTADFLSSGVEPVISGIKNVSGSATVSVYQAESNFAVNGNSITFTGDNYDTPLKLAMGGDTISTVEGLLTGDAISGLTAGAVVKGTAGQNLTVNNTAIQVTGSDFTVNAAASGYSSVTGVEAGATFNTVEDATALLVPKESGTFTFGNDGKYTFSAVPTLKASGDTLKEVIGLTNGQSVELEQEEDGLYIGSNKIKLEGTNVDDDKKVTFTMGDNNTVKTVENLKDSVSGLSAGVDVKITATSEVAVNKKAVQITDSDSAYTVKSTAGGYGTISGIGTGALIQQVESGVIVIPDAEGTYKFGDDATAYEFDAIPTLVAGASNALASIGGLTADQTVILNHAEENGLYIGSNKIKLEGDNVKSTDKVKFTMGDNNTVASVENLKDSVSGLSTGTIVKVAAGDDAVNINGTDLNVDKAATVYAATGGYSTVNVDASATFTAVKSGAIIIPSAKGTFTFGDNAYVFDAKPTLVAGANSALASIGGLTSGQSVTLYKDETALKVGKNTIALTKNLDTNAIKLTMGGDTISTVEGLLTDDTISGLSAGAVVKGTDGQSITVNTKAIQITGSTFDVHAAANGYSSVTGIADNAVFNTVGDNTALLIPSAAGTFTFGDGGKYKFSAATTLKASGEADSASLTDIIGLTADQSVTIYQAESGLKVGKDTIVLGGTIDDTNGVELIMNAAGNVATVKNLQGEISGLTSGTLVEVKASTADVKINTAALQVSKDVTAHVKDSSGYDYVTIKPGAEVTTGKNVSFVTDGIGTYKFGDHSFEISGDTEVTINTGASSQVTEINGVTDALITFGADETALKINGKSVQVNAGDVLKIDGNGVVSGFEGATEGGTYELPANVTLAVDASSNVKINGKDLLTGQNATVHTTADGYDWVSGIKTGAEVTAVESGVSLVTDGAGEFAVKGHTYNTDDAQITLKTGVGGVVTEIAGLDADKYIEFSQLETNLTVNGKAVTFTVPDTSEKLKLTIGNNATIASVENLRGNISGLTAGTLVQVAATSAVNINTAALQTDDGDVTVHATADGYDYVTGLSDNAAVTTAQNVSLVTDGAGTFVVKGHTYTTDDAQITLKTNANSVVTEIAGLDADKYVEFSQAETNLTVNGKAITFTGAGSNSGEKLKVNIGNNATIASVENLRGTISGLSAGTLVQVTKDTDVVQINGKSLNTTDGDVTVHATANGYDTITGLSTGKVVTAIENNAYIVTDSAGTFTFGTGANAQTFTTDDTQITLQAGASNKITAITGLDADKTLKLAHSENDGLSVNGNLITVKGATAGNEVTFTMGNNDTIASVKNLKGDIKGLSAGALVQVTKNDAAVQINGVALQTTDNDVTVHATADGYDTVTGLSAGKAVTAAKQNATLVTDAAGAFTFETDKVFTITDDNSVAFVMGAENKLAGVYELDGKVSGDFTEGLKVDGRDVLITVDETADIFADGSKVTKIEGLNGGANVQKSGGAETLKTANAGTFTFGAKTYEISAGTADFLSSGDVPVISGIKNLSDNVEVTVYQNETALTVGDNTLKLGGVNTTNGLKLAMNGSTISAAGNLIASGEVSGLSAGANVHVATGEKVTVNGLALQITDSDNAFDVTTAANGYAAITGVAGDGLNVSKAVNASIEIETNDNADTAEEFVFGSAPNQKTYTINGDVDQKVTFVTDGNTSVTAVGGLIGKLKSDATTNKINGANVYSSNPEVWIVATDGNGISKLTNVDDDDTVSVPAGVEVFVQGSGNDVADFTINGIAYHLIGDSDTISVTDKKIKGLAANARLTLSGAEGNYVVNSTELYITPGRNVVIGEATGAHLSDPDAVDFSAITPADEIIERVFGENVAAGITPVTNSGDDATTNESPGAVIMTGSGGTAALSGSQQLAVVKAARNTVNISGTDSSVVASANVNVNLQSGNSNARLMQTADTMTVSGYDYSTGAGIQISNADVIAAVKEKAVTFGSQISLGESGPAFNIQSYANDKENIVNLYDITGNNKQTVHYANSNKAALTGDSSANVFVGSWNGTVNGVVITGGNGNDTAFGGTGDTFNLGNGDNYLELSSDISGSAKVELTATSGNTTVKGFEVNNYSSGDIVKLNAARAQVYYTADGLIFTNANGQASLSIQDVTAAYEDGANGISYVKVRIDDTGDGSDTPTNTAVAREGMAINATDDGTTAYVGNNSGIELNDLSGAIDLDAGLGKFGGTDVTFRGITSIKGGSGDMDIIGASTVNNTLEAGTGGGSIWGKGAANDLLIAADSDSKTKETTFRFESGDGNDTISNIQFYDSSASNETNNLMDVVSISGSASTSLSTSGNDVIIKYTDSGDTMTIKDAVNKKFKVSSGAESTVQIASNEVTFDGSGGIYYATEANASLVVSSDVNVEDSTINLKGGSNYTIDSNINIVDASAVNGPLSIVGNAYNNTLRASSGGSTLFGSTVPTANDLFIGGSASDVFRYKSGGIGNDTIQGAGSGDTIDFFNISTPKTVQILKYECNSVNDNYMQLQVGSGSNNTLTIVNSDFANLKFNFQNISDLSFSEFSQKVRKKSGVNISADLAEDYWENDVYANELLDGDADLVQRDSAAVTFDNAENISYASANLLTGDIQFSVASGEQVYNFSALVDKRNK